MINSLSHYTIAAVDMEKNILFYSKILGLIHGKALLGAEAGVYFYLKDNHVPIVHVVDQKLYRPDDDKDFQLNADALDETPNILKTGALDHIAFSLDIKYYTEFEKRFKKHQLNYQVGNDLMPRIKQIWALDPNGIKVELNFL